VIQVVIRQDDALPTTHVTTVPFLLAPSYLATASSQLVHIWVLLLPEWRTRALPYQCLLGLPPRVHQAAAGGVVGLTSKGRRHPCLTDARQTVVSPDGLLLLLVGSYLASASFRTTSSSGR